MAQKSHRLLGEMKVVSLDAVRDVLAATAMSASDGSGTAYTTIYDPVDLTATLFFARDYEHPLRFDLKTELARGPHVVELEDMASPSTRRAPWAVEARAELERLIEARIDRTVDRGAAKADLIGHYTIDPSADVVAIPPVMLDSVSVVWDRESPHLVVAPEGVSFDLRPAGKDTWFHANVSAKPQIDFVLRRDEAVQAAGFGAEVAASVAEAIGCPVRRLGAPRSPVGYAPTLEREARVDAARIAAAARALLQR